MNLFTPWIVKLGQLTHLFYEALLALPEIHKTPRLAIQEMEKIGVNSLPVVILTSLFIGMVSAVQTAYQVKDFVPLEYLGVGIAKAVLIELGPVITALVVAGRSGAGIAAEIGSMRVTEQIDALTVMGINPVRYLVLPRLMAGVVSLPLLTVFAEFSAIMAAAVVSKYLLFVPMSLYFSGIRMFFAPVDLWGGLLKSVVFGGIIALMGSFHGYYAEGGATGVGRATTEAVVSSSVLILAADYILGTLIYG